MKIKTTTKELKKRYGHRHALIIPDGMGQNLFSEHDMHAYTCGVYGWNYDAYFLNNYVILRGYRGMFGVDVDSEIISKYDHMASDLKKAYFIGGNYKELHAKIADLQADFLKEVTQNI